jgi:hypothetical protein
MDRALQLSSPTLEKHEKKRQVQMSADVHFFAEAYLT